MIVKIWMDLNVLCACNRDEVTKLKSIFFNICGIKPLVRSYLPYRDAHLRPRIKSLFGFHRNIITVGEISEEV